MNQHKRGIASLTLIPSDGGKFEVKKNGKLVYSKLKAGRFPDDGEVQEILIGDRDPVVG